MTSPALQLDQPKLVLHPFSGQRHTGDVQDVFERRLRTEGLEHSVLVISIDSVLPGDRQDLSQPANCEFWMARLVQGQVLAIFARPPCETWSGSLDGGGPRPLRGELWPWGLPLLRDGERERVLLANTLLAVTFRFAFATQASGAAMVIEHPAFPPRNAAKNPPSIWCLPLCQALLQQPGVDLHAVDQGTLGPEVCKPTSLLSVHVPDLGRLIGTSASRPGDQCPRGLPELLVGGILAQSRLRAFCRTQFHDVWAAVDAEVSSCYAALDYTLEWAGE